MKLLKKAAAVLTVALLIMNSIVICYADSYTTVNITASEYFAVSYGDAQYGKLTGTYTKNNKTFNETVHTVTAKTGDLYEIQVTSGNTLYGKSTLSTKLNGYNAEEGNRVVAAINGDFFSHTTGLPLGIQIANGVVYSSNNYEYEKSVGRWSVGFKKDGTAVVGQPDIRVKVISADKELTLDRLNAYPDTNLTMLTSDYADKTYWNSAFNHDVVVLETTDKLTLSNEVETTFVSFLTNVKDPVKTEQNKLYIICPASDTRLKNMFSGKMAGDNITVTVTDTTGKFNETVTAFGGGNLLINNGQMRYPSTYDKDIAYTFTSRSALGIKPDGTVVFYTVERTYDGTTSGGVWLESVAQALFDMGCTYAVNLDGGGSATIAAAKDGGNAKVLNRCQDGSERKISNCILLVSNEKSPVIVQDFENDMTFTDIYESPDNLVTAQVDGNAYTGVKSLELDYTLKGFNHTVTTLFDSPVDLKGFDRINLTVGADKTGVMLSAVLEKDGTRFVKDISTTDFEGYRHFELETENADKLCGFEIKYVLASRNSGKIYVDRIVGYNGFSLDDTKAPTLPVDSKDGKISALSKDDAYKSGPDTNGYYFKINGQDVTPVLDKQGAYSDVSTVTGNKTVLAQIDATDILGNRARKTMLFKSIDFNRELPFADMKEGRWDELYIRYCNENGIIDGIEQDGTMMFFGSDSITRAQFCTMLVRKTGVDIKQYTDVILPYEDLDKIPSWALPYVKAAYGTGIMKGSATDTGVSFFALNNITRAEAATAVDRMITPDTRLAMQRVYTDEKDIANWANPYVASVTAKGVFDGDTDGKFHPKRNLSRSEAAAIMIRI